jgi:perosamine synthetase
MTFAATGEVVRYLGAKPILVDCRNADLNMDVADADRQLRRALARGEKVTAIVPVHFAGQIGDVQGVKKLAQEYNLKVVEDAAHCCPAYFRTSRVDEWKSVGTDADVTCFSFYANKPITTGEGGMACTASDAAADRMRIMSLHGISRDAWQRFLPQGSCYYEILEAGYKYNLTDVAAAIGLRQLAKADAMHQRRRFLANLYTELLADVSEIRLPTELPDRIHSWHLFFIRLQLDQIGVDRHEVIRQLKIANIGTSVHYMPLHMHPYYRDSFGCSEEDQPVAAAIYQEIISLPLYPGMSEEQVRYVSAQLKRVIAGTNKRSTITTLQTSYVSSSLLSKDRP